MFDASTLEVFIASTNDLMDERVASEDVLRTWNQSNGSTRQIILKPLRWEKDATPELGPGGFQEVINSNLLDNADILIGIIGKRLGSPTKTSIAGTVDEIEQFYQAKKPVLLFFSDREFNLSENLNYVPTLLTFEVQNGEVSVRFVDNCTAIQHELVSG
jgi:hypothetical protein